MSRHAVIAAVLALAVAAPASAQTLAGILSKNLEARGGYARIKAVQTMRTTGAMTIGDAVAPFVMEQSRPNSWRLEYTIKGLSGIRAFDGTVGWAVMPGPGGSRPQRVSGEELKELHEQADFDGPLVDYQTKGNTVELAGRETRDGIDTWKLKVTLKGGDVRYIYLDVARCLEVRSEGRFMVRGAEVEQESTLSDYRPVNGLMVPFTLEGGQKGSPERVKMVIQKVDLNVPIDQTRYRMPATQ